MAAPRRVEVQITRQAKWQVQHLARQARYLGPFCCCDVRCVSCNPHIPHTLSVLHITHHSSHSSPSTLHTQDFTPCTETLHRDSRLQNTTLHTSHITLRTANSTHYTLNSTFHPAHSTFTNFTFRRLYTLKTPRFTPQTHLWEHRCLQGAFRGEQVFTCMLGDDRPTVVMELDRNLG